MDEHEGRVLGSVVRRSASVHVGVTCARLIYRRKGHDELQGRSSRYSECTSYLLASRILPRAKLGALATDAVKMHIDSATMLTQDESGIGRGTARCGTEIHDTFK